MSDWMKWMIVLLGIVVFAVVGMTALDKYDERTCRENPNRRIVGYETVPARAPQKIPGIPGSTEKTFTLGSPATRQPIFEQEACDGYLPW